MVSSSTAASLATIVLGVLAVAFVALLFRRYFNVLGALRSERDYLTKIISAANEGIYVTDRHRQLILWNKAAEAISGYRAEEVIGRSCYNKILCHTDRQGNELCSGRCPLVESVEHGVVRGPELIYLRHRDGRRIPVEVKTAPLRDDEDNVIGGVEMFEDVSFRLEKERLLTERREKLETVLDSISDGILFLDTRGNIDVFNYALSDLFSLGKDVLGKSIAGLPDSMHLRQALTLAEQGFLNFSGAGDGKPAADVVCERRQGGLRCWASSLKQARPSSMAACYDCMNYRIGREFLEQSREFLWNDRMVSVMSSFIELREVNELWEVVVFHDVSAEKLDAALKVAGAAAHELRQPLQVVLMLTEMLTREAGEQDPLRQHVEAIKSSCVRMDEIIKKMNTITSYRIKDYMEGLQILDFDKSLNESKGGRQ